MEKKVFRDISIKRLSSPEQLDQLFRLTSPKAWLALIAISIILIAMLVWSFMGSIATKVEGAGILLNNAGVYTLNSDISGQIIDIRFANGDMVSKGDVIARVEQPGLVDEINSLVDLIDDMKENNELASQEYTQALISLNGLREELDYQSRIIAPISGRIMELNIRKGSVINKGDTLAILEQFDSTVRLEAVIYISAEQSGKIKSGMEAQIVPSIVNKEEYGFIIGRVISVDEYPATEQSMQQTLGNQELVKMINSKGVSVGVKIDLTPNQQNISGYKWSTHKGPPLVIPSGTLVQVDIVIDREKPIEKIIPNRESEVR